MLGTTIITLILMSLVYPVLTRGKITRGRTIWLDKQRLIRRYMKLWKPVSEESEVIIKNDEVQLKGGWKTRNSLRKIVRRGLSTQNAKVIGRVSFVIILVLGMFRLTGNSMFLAGLGAAFTSKATGDWDAVGQTTWNEANAPVSGDTAAIQTGHNVRIDNGTGNEACLSIDLQAGGILTIDSEGAGALSFTFDDAAGAGFGASAGALTCVGTAGSVITVTAANPGSNPWDFRTNMDITADYTTFSYYLKCNPSSATVDIDNCTFDNADQEGFYFSGSVTITSFTNNTISNSGTFGFVWQNAQNYTAFDNIIITNAGSSDIRQLASPRIIEFTNSNFDVTAVALGAAGAVVISDNHNDVAGDWYFWTQSTSNKSSITNDFASSDTVTIFTGELVCDEATAHTNLTIKTGGTLNVSGGVTETVTNTGTITVESGGTLDWTGTDGNLITLVSDSGGTQWSLDAQAGSTVTVQYVDVTDSDATAGDEIDASDGTSVGLGQNNDNWDFGAIGHAQGFVQLPFWLEA